MSIQVKIHADSYCGECQQTKSYMQGKIIFTEYDVEKDEIYLCEFYARGGRGIPNLFVNG